MCIRDSVETDALSQKDMGADTGGKSVVSTWIALGFACPEIIAEYGVEIDSGSQRFQREEMCIRDRNKEILIGFLNALFDGKQVIEDVIYLNTEHLGSKEPDRRAVFDVYCENEKGEKILIEMQRCV